MDDTDSGISDEDRRRVRRILDALQDGQVRYQAKVAIYPIMDTLQLLIQKPLIFAIIRQSGTHFDITFSTCCDPEYQQAFDAESNALLRRLRDGLPVKDLFIPLTKLGDDGRCFYLFASQGKPLTAPPAYPWPIKGSIFPRVSSEDAKILRELITSLGQHENGLSSHITSTLEIASRPPTPSFTSKEWGDGLIDRRLGSDDEFRLPEEVQDEYSSCMRRIVSKAFSEAANSSILQHDYERDNKNWLNLYCVVRRAVHGKRDGKLPYTAQYILSEDQKKAIISRFGSDEVANDFEISFGKQCRTVYDPVFYSGVSEFADEKMNSDEYSELIQSTPGDARDHHRDDAEQKLLGRRKPVRVDERRAYRFIVPIHVGGIVWVTLFTTPLNNLDKDWERNYYLYRVLLTQIAERLRVAAKDEYRARLRAIFESEMAFFENGEKSEVVCKRINRRWAQETAYFPYNRIELGTLPLMGKKNGDDKEFVTLEYHANPHECFQGDVGGFDQFNESDLKILTYELDRLFKASLSILEQHRFALRTASAAIMGRNMSHNIGSHVVARYANAVGRLDEQRQRVAGTQNDAVPSGKEDHRAIFLRYLQRRMDFIADVSTADRASWSQSLVLCDALGALDFEAEKERINKGTEFKPILLSYITGKEAQTATVDRSAVPPELRFSCPGGEVGLHALYVILENIVRNSARHNKLPCAQIRLMIELDLAFPNSEFWAVTIVDLQSRVRDTATVADINKIIGFEEFLKDDGSPNPKYWGIREMQICAQYLRRLSIQDLGDLSVDPPVLEANEHAGAGCLAYRIYLQRAKLCALVVPTKAIEDAKLTREKRKSLLMRGIDVIGDRPGDLGDLGGYNYVVSAPRLLPIGDSDARLELPVRTLEVDEGEIRELLRALQRDGLKIDDWLEGVHKLLWTKYRDARVAWRGKAVNAIVTWLNESQVDRPRNCFFHTAIGSERFEKFCGDDEREQNGQRIGLAWVDHANGGQFKDDRRPRLASAYKYGRKDEVPSLVFAEVLDSLSPHKHLLQQQEDGSAEGHELIAAALARVAVLDERVQSELCKEYRAGIRYDVLWPCMGIWVPPKEGQTDLDNPNFEAINRFLGDPANIKSQFPIDFLVLHLTLLENLRRIRKDACEQDTLDRLCEGTRVGDGCEIIIITGRGVPTIRRLDGDILRVRYLPVSALLEYLVARPSKLGLMRALWSAGTLG